MNKSDVQALYASALERAKRPDSKGNTNADPASVAFHMVRSEVHEALHRESPTPGEHPDDEGDPDLVHARQKAHGKKLWKRADELVAAAGLSEKGMN